MEPIGSFHEQSRSEGVNMVEITCWVARTKNLETTEGLGEIKSPRRGPSNKPSTLYTLDTTMDSLPRLTTGAHATHCNRCLLGLPNSQVDIDPFKCDVRW